MGKTPLLDNTPISELFLYLTTPEVKGLVNLTALPEISWLQFLWQS